MLGISKKQFLPIAGRWSHLSALAKTVMLNEIKRAKARPAQAGRELQREPGYGENVVTGWPVSEENSKVKRGAQLKIC